MAQIEDESAIRFFVSVSSKSPSWLSAWAITDDFLSVAVEHLTKSNFLQRNEENQYPTRLLMKQKWPLAIFVYDPISCLSKSNARQLGSVWTPADLVRIGVVHVLALSGLSLVSSCMWSNPEYREHPVSRLEQTTLALHPGVRRFLPRRCCFG